MRLLTRVLALSVTSATLVALAPSVAFAAGAAPTSEVPAANSVFPTAPGQNLTTVSATFGTETSILTVPNPPTFTVTPPANDNGNFSCSAPTVTNNNMLSCTPSHSGAAFTAGVYTVSYSFSSVPSGATSGSYTFVYDGTAPTGLSISPSVYNLATPSGTQITVSGTAPFAGASVKATLSSSGGGAPVTHTVTAAPDSSFTSSFTAPADGTLTATAAVTSTVNDGPSASATALKDLVAPSLSSTTPGDGGSEKPTNNGVNNGYLVTASEPLSHTSTKVQILDSTNLDVTPTASYPNPNQIAFVPTTAWKPGTYTVNIRLYDAAGNPYPVLSNPAITRTFTIDNIAPAAPTLTTATNPVNLANTTAFTASGTAEAASTVAVTVSDGLHTATGSTTAASDQSFRLSGLDVSALTDGPLTVTAQATDAAGNIGPVSNTLNVSKDTVAPVVQNVMFDKTLYNATSDHTAVLSAVVGDGGTGPEADPVRISVDDTDPTTAPVTATVPAGAVNATSGAFSATLDLSSLKDGTLTATVVATDVSGNPSAPATKTTTLDTVAPAKPTITAPAYANTANASAYTVSGTTSPSVAVTVSITDSANATVTSSSLTSTGSGAYSWTANLSTLADGPLQVSVVATSTSNNTSTSSVSRTKDTVSPAAPGNVVAPTWITAANTASTPLSGTGEVGSTVTVTAHDSSTHSATATQTVNGTGHWTVTVDTSTFMDGAVSFSLQAQDPAGNTSGIVTASSTKDTVAPSAATNVAAAPSAYLLANKTGPLTVSGNAQNTNTLVVDVTVADQDPATADLTATVSVTAGASTGSFLHSFNAADVSTLTDGTLTITAVVRDQAGNTSPPATIHVVKDTTPLALLSATPANGSVHQSVAGVVAAFNEVLDQAATAITVTNVLGNTLNGATTYSNGGKTVTFTPTSAFTQAGGPYSVTIHGVDQNDSADTVNAAPTTFSIDTTAPPAPTVDAFTNPVNAANVTAFAASGTETAPDAASVTLTVSAGGQTVSTTVPVTNQAYSVSGLDVSTLPDGPLAVSATSQDAVGNVSTAASQSSVKDTVAPVVTVRFASPYVGSASASSALITGTVGDGNGAAEADALTLTLNDTDPATAPVTAQATSLADGTFSVHADLHSLSDGTLTLAAQAVDAAGNPSAAATGTAVKDVVAPAAPAFTVSETVTAAGRSLVATGTAEPRAHVLVGAADGSTAGHVADVVANATTGAFSAPVDLTGLAAGGLTVSARAVDAAGNSSAGAADAVPTATGGSVTPATDATHFLTTVRGQLGEPAQLTLTASDGITVVRGGTFTVDPNTQAFSGTLDLTSLAPGQVSLVLSTRDQRGSTVTVLASTTRGWGAATVVLNALPGKVVAGSPITIAGTLRRTDPSVAVGAVQVVGRDAAGRVALRTNVGVSSTGTFAYRYVPRVNLSYTVTYFGDSRNTGATSVGRSVLALAKVSASAPTGSHTRNAVISGGVFPSKAGRVVTLYRVTSTGLVRLKTARLSSRSTYVFSVLLPKGYTTLVVAIPATPGNAAGSIRFRALRS